MTPSTFRRPPRHPFLVVSLSTLAFALALALRGRGNVWLLTGLAAAFSLLLATRSRLAIRRLFPRDLLSVVFGGAAGILGVLLTHVAFRWLAAPFPILEELVADLYRSLQDPPGPLAAAPVMLLVVLAEEIVWRGVLVEELRERWARRKVFLIATGAYVLPQIGGWNLALAAAALGMGAVWTALRLFSRNLWPPVVCHLVWSLSLAFLTPLPISPG